MCAYKYHSMYVYIIQVNIFMRIYFRYKQAINELNELSRIYTKRLHMQATTLKKRKRCKL